MMDVHTTDPGRALLLVRHNQRDSRERYFLVVFLFLIKLGAKVLEEESARRISGFGRRSAALNQPC
jgi:hypothetical protein